MRNVVSINENFEILFDACADQKGYVNSHLIGRL
jgi:hypothetical protein